MSSGATGTASVNVSCAGATFSWSITGGTITGGAGTPNITFTAGGAGTLTLNITVTNQYGCTDSKSANVAVTQAPFGAPASLLATNSSTSVSLTWASVASADHYEVFRSTDGVNFTLRGTAPTPSFSELGLAASTAFFYKVRAVKVDNTTSAFSAIDPVTTVLFSDDPLSGCSNTIRAAHVTQLRNAINIVRAAVGLPAFTFTDPTLTAGMTIKAVHITQMRTALNAALAVIGVTPVYTDSTITPGATAARALHITELRDRLR
jgi:hypothetical protein